MKLKIYNLLIFAFLATQFVFAQVPKKVIVEHFTNTRCSICGSKNPAFYTNLAAHPDALHISYHPSSPYSNCVFNQHNKAENDGRTKYYGTFGSTPDLIVQGVISPASIAFSSPEIFNKYLNQTSEISISIVQTKTVDQKILASVTIKTESAHSYNNVSLLVGVAEKLVKYNAPNGENEHHDVFRKSMTDIEGDLITLPAVGESITLNYEVDYNTAWDFDEMFTYAVLNNASNKEVIQSEAALPSDNTTFVTEIDAFQNLEMYPNPVSSVLTIILDESTEIIAKIYAISGQLLIEQSFFRTTQVDFTTFDKGVYLVEISGEKGKSVRKLVVE